MTVTRVLLTVAAILLPACAMTVDELRERGSQVSATHTMAPALAADYVKAFHIKGCPGQLYLGQAEIIRESEEGFVVKVSDAPRPTPYAAIVYEVVPGRITAYHRFDNTRDQAALVVESIAAGRAPTCPPS